MFEFLFKYPRDFYAQSELAFTGGSPPWLIATLAAVVLTGIVIALARRRHHARLYQLTAIGLLQCAMVAVVLIVLALPTLTAERLRDGENSVALMLDTSDSMAYGDARPRFDDALSSLSGALIDDPDLDLTSRLYEFAAVPVLVDSFGTSGPGGGQTAIGRSVTAVLREARRSPLAAVVLSSDGGDNAGGISLQEMADIASFGVPVHTIGVGRAAMAEDLELTEVALPGNALPGSTLSARLAIRHDGGGTARVKVYDGEELLASAPVELGADASMTTAWVDVEMRVAGHRRIRFTLDPLDGEQELRNNSRIKLVEVADRHYRILYFEGEPRWEYKFLRRAIDDDRDLHIASLLRVSPNKIYRQGLESPQELEHGFPVRRDELFVYDALIVGSVEAAYLSPDQQAMIREFVSERGGSLLMLAGPNGLGNGGWGQSAIADVLPVSLPPSTRNSFFRRRAYASLTPQGSASRMLRLADTVQGNLEAWSEMPAVADYQVTGRQKPAATTLLTAGTVDGELPLLIGQPFGRGHSYVLATGGTWRWQMSLPVEDQRHQLFWRQLLRALIATAPANESLRAYARPGSTRIDVRAEFRDDAYRPLDDIEVTAVISGEAGDHLTVGLRPSADEPGIYRAGFDAPDSGAYYIEAVAARDGEPVTNVRSSIHHQAGEAEHFNIRRNAALLGRLSEATGGRYLEPHEISALPGLLRYSSAGVTETEYRPIWDAPAFFLLLLLLKSGEWLLRRRWSSI